MEQTGICIIFQKIMEKYVLKSLANKLSTENDHSLFDILKGLTTLWREGIEARIERVPTGKPESCMIVIGKKEECDSGRKSQFRTECSDYADASGKLYNYYVCIDAFRRALRSGGWKGRAHKRDNEYINVNQPLFYPYIHLFCRMEYKYRVKPEHRDLEPLFKKLGIISPCEGGPHVFHASKDFADCLNECLIGEVVCEPAGNADIPVSIYEGSRKFD